MENFKDTFLKYFLQQYGQDNPNVDMPALESALDEFEKPEVQELVGNVLNGGEGFAEQSLNPNSLFDLQNYQVNPFQGYSFQQGGNVNTYSTDAEKNTFNYGAIQAYSSLFTPAQLSDLEFLTSDSTKAAVEKRLSLVSTDFKKLTSKYDKRRAVDTVLNDLAARNISQEEVSAADGVFNKAKQYNIDYLQSEVAEERLRGQMGRNDAFNSADEGMPMADRLSKTLRPIQKSTDNAAFNVDGGAHRAKPATSEIFINPFALRNKGASAESVMSHEFGHLGNALGVAAQRDIIERGTFGQLTPGHKQFIKGLGATGLDVSTAANTRQAAAKSRMEEAKKKYGDSWNKHVSKDDKRAGFLHNAVPSEIRSDINSFRFLMKDLGIHDDLSAEITKDKDGNINTITKEDWEKLKARTTKNGKLDKGVKRTTENFEEEDILWMLNNIAQVDAASTPATNIAQLGGTIQNQQTQPLAAVMPQMNQLAYATPYLAPSNGLTLGDTTYSSTGNTTNSGGSVSHNMQEGGTVDVGVENDAGESFDASGDEYLAFANVVADTTNTNVEDLEEVMRQIAFHESGHTLNPKQKQIGGGPGRGMFQFEAAALKTAANRYKNFAEKKNLPIPTWVTDISKGKIKDATTLSADKQKTLFLADQAAVGRSRKSLEQTIKGGGDLGEYWAKHWWKGEDKDKAARLSSFADSQNLYKQERPFLTTQTFDLPEVVVSAPRNLANDTKIDNTAYTPQTFADLQNLRAEDNSFQQGGKAYSYAQPMRMDTLNNTPSNFMNNIPSYGNNIALSNNSYVVPKMQMFDSTVFGNNLGRTPENGISELQFGGKINNFFRGVGRGVGDIGKLAAENLTAGLYDFDFNYKTNAIGNLANKTEGVRDVWTGLAPMAANAVLPGAGTAVQAGRGAVDVARANQQAQSGFNASDFGYNPNRAASTPMPTAPNNSLPTHQRPDLGGVMGSVMMGLLGNGMLGNVFSAEKGGKIDNKSVMGYRTDSPYKDAPTLTIKSNKIDMTNTDKNLLLIPDNDKPVYAKAGSGQYHFPNSKKVKEIPFFQMGGGVSAMVAEPLVEIQTERGEEVIHLDGTITKVNAKKLHKHMKKDVITDIVPDGTYIASDTKSMRIGQRDMKDIIMGYAYKPYREDKKGMLPEKITFVDEIFRRKKEKITPAEMTRRVKRKYPTLTLDQDVEDIFINNTNEQNITSRLPYLQEIININDEKKDKKSKRKAPSFQYGGHVQNKQIGGVVSAGVDLAKLAAAGVFTGIGGNQVSRGIKEQYSSLNDFYDNTINNLSPALTQQLRGANTGVAGVNILGQLGQDTNVDATQLNLSPLQNFNTRTPRSFIDAAATPTFDANSVADRLGPRAAASMLATQNATVQKARNDAATSQFSADRELEFNRTNRLLGLQNQQAAINTGASNQERVNRNKQLSGVTGSLSTMIGNDATITQGDYNRNVDLMGRQAALQGQDLLLRGQNNLSMANSILGIPTESIASSVNRLFPGNAGQAQNVGLVDPNAYAQAQQYQNDSYINSLPSIDVNVGYNDPFANPYSSGGFGTIG